MEQNACCVWRKKRTGKSQNMKRGEERERESSSVARFMTAAAQRSRSAGGKEGGGGREGDTPKAKHDEVYLRNGKPQGND